MSFYFGSPVLSISANRLAPPAPLSLVAPPMSRPPPTTMMQQPNSAIKTISATQVNIPSSNSGISINFPKPAPLAVPAQSGASAAAQAQADAEAAQAAQLAALQAQQAQAERDAAAAASYTSELVSDPSADSGGFPWIWVGGAAAALGLIVVGFAVTKKKPTSVAGYRRHKRRSKR